MQAAVRTLAGNGVGCGKVKTGGRLKVEASPSNRTGLNETDMTSPVELFLLTLRKA
ncbi:hypothetical protein D9M68_865230 [compost metagenome]